MPKFARAICTLPSDTGLPEDAAVNVWHFEGDDSQTWAEDADDLADRIGVFYAAIGGRYGATLAGTVNVRIYNLAEAEPRIPVYEDDYTFTPAATAYPTEVAVCISMQATPASGENQARRRGRVFIGPLMASAHTIESGRVVVSTGTVSVLGDSAAALAIGPDAGDFRLAVFSPTTFAETSSLAASFNDVTDIWIDNAFDTQRRRGTTATLRTHFVPA